MIHGLGERLQEQRVANHLSQKEVAGRLNISASVISNYESGERSPSIENLVALSRVYHCSTDYLLGIDKTDTSLVDASALSTEQRKRLEYFLASFSNLEK
ncbi:MAG: helix-turn-helix transcriptional regulator [Lachnospiraceae bacterium]|nr:helix-turn-helix transcriptional regulator [Lachnospiraceae bacterium]